MNESVAHRNSAGDRIYIGEKMMSRTALAASAGGSYSM